MRRYGHSKLSKMAAAAILNLFKSKIAPLDRPRAHCATLTSFSVARLFGAPGIVRSNATWALADDIHLVFEGNRRSLRISLITCVRYHVRTWYRGAKTSLSNAVQLWSQKTTDLCAIIIRNNKKAVLPQGNRAMPQVFFSVEVRQQHSLQV